MSHSIIIADDHPLFRKGIHDFLNEKGFNIIGEATDGKMALELINTLKPDIAILDINMPEIDGLSVAKACAMENSMTKIVILSYHKEEEFVYHAKTLNISGYILKEDALSEILECISNIQNGFPYYSKALLVNKLEGQSSIENVQQLTASELKILKLIADNKNNKFISEFLFVSERTVEKHRSNIIEKLNIPKKTHGLMEWVINHKEILKNLLNSIFF